MEIIIKGWNRSFFYKNDSTQIHQKIYLCVESLSKYLHFNCIYAVFNGIFSMLKTGPKLCQGHQMYEKKVYRKFLDLSISINEVIAVICKIEWMTTIELHVCIFINDWSLRQIYACAQECNMESEVIRQVYLQFFVFI